MIATAAHTASIAFTTPNYYENCAFARTGDSGNTSGLHKEWSLRLNFRLTVPEALQSATLLPATWLATVQDRIRRSIIPHAQENDGRYLDKEIVSTAVTFFEQTSDLLPSEPHIYSSNRGDLVAEFRGVDGSMTGIISKDFAVLFAVANGDAIQETMTLGKSRRATRNDLQLFTEKVRARLHGSVETRP